MAKRGRKPKDKSIDDLDAALRAEIATAVETQTSQSVRSLYSRFGLAERGVGIAGFEKWAGRLRREARGRAVQQRLESMEDCGETEEQLIAKLRRRVLVEANARAECGDTKAYELVALWSRIMDHEKLKIEQAVDARAAAKHEVWQEEVATKVRSAIEGQTRSGETMTRDQVADMIDDIIRGKA